MQFSNILPLVATAFALVHNVAARGDFSRSCTGYYIDSDHYLRATCNNGQGGTTNSALDLNACIGGTYTGSPLGAAQAVATYAERPRMDKRETRMAGYPLKMVDVLSWGFEDDEAVLYISRTFQATRNGGRKLSILSGTAGSVDAHEFTIDKYAFKQFQSGN
ncbi:hypothetical protein CVT24_006961 [Panaeolus cyanescens]|uniref:Cyanovirin-N domain-containing protein n=1 Tax=Panaeolus cyanescens TaxID=181874 RepID=A0A409W5G3_9AGAR|nr:hypothetical protein CVT24_006961 [Panaeolus cyanescens]